MIKTHELSGFAAITIENEDLAATVLPQLGGRIASLRNLHSGREWCWRPPGPSTLHRNRYGDPFRQSPHVGIDECVPTIEACSYRGRSLPCHGEAWSEAWDVDADAATGTVRSRIVLRQSPLKLSRIASLAGNRLDLEYELENLNNDDEEYLWALHPMLRFEPDDELELPREVDRLLVETAANVNGARHGAWIAWPQTPGGIRLNRFDLGAVDSASKLKAFTGRLREGWARCLNRSSGDYFELCWDTESIPYLGVWISRGGYQGWHVAGLEATNAPSDALVRDGKIVGRKLPPQSRHHWRVALRVGSKAQKDAK